MSVYTENRYQSDDLDFVTTALLEDLEPVLEKVMDLVFTHLRVDRGFIVLFDDEGEPKLELFRATEPEGGEATDVPISRTILDLVVGQKVAVLTHDAQADQRIKNGRCIGV